MGSSRYQKATYDVNDWENLYKEFYQYFDFEFWRYKLSYLNYLNSDDVPGFKLMDDDDIDFIRLHKYIHQEIHFSYMHLLECFFALILAEASELPPWLYLTVYTNDELYKNINKLAHEDYKTLFGVETFEDFLIKAVYGGLPLSRSGPEWGEHVETLLFFFRSFIQDFVSYKDEYNSYKHGLRVCNLKTSLSLNFEAQGQTVTFNNVASSVFLSTNKNASGKLEVRKNTNGFNPKKDLALAFIAYWIMKSTYQAFQAKQSGSRNFNVRGFSKNDIAEIQSYDVDSYSASDPM
ncbi:hypothetical protein D3C72_559580 [compost metagenome]